MTKVIYASLKTSKTAPRNVSSKRVSGPNGHRETVYSVDADSSTFGEDLSYVFRQNVLKARKANKARLDEQDRPGKR